MACHADGNPKLAHLVNYTLHMLITRLQDNNIFQSDLIFLEHVLCVFCEISSVTLIFKMCIIAVDV